MRKLISSLLMALCFALPAFGETDRAGAMLFDLANALASKDLSRLRELIDAQSMVYVSTILRAPGYPKKDPLETLTRTTSLDSFRRTEKRLFDRLGNGTEQDECRWARRSGCPWVPEAMFNPVLIAESGDTAICAVDNKHGIRTWLILGMQSGRWRVWGMAESDREARLIASREFQKTLATIRGELPVLLEAKEKARAARNRSEREEYEKRAAESEQRNRTEKAAREAVACRILAFSTEKQERPASVQTLLHLTLEVHNANSFAMLPKNWVLTLSHPDGKAEKTFVLDHYRDGDNAPLTAGERKTLILFPLWSTRQSKTMSEDGSTANMRQRPLWAPLSGSPRNPS